MHELYLDLTTDVLNSGSLNARKIPEITGIVVKSIVHVTLDNYNVLTLRDTSTCICSMLF